MGEFPKDQSARNILPDVQAGIEALPDDLFDHDFAYGQTYDPKQIFRSALSQIYDASSVSPQGAFLGTSSEAQDAIQRGLLNSMQRVASGEALESGETIPRRIISPIDEYFENPDRRIVETMERRSADLKKSFMLDDLRDCVFRNHHHNGRGPIPLSTELSIEGHPDYKWARVSVEMGLDTMNSTPVRYEFYTDKPEDEGGEPTSPAARFRVTFIYKEPVPPAYKSDETYLAGMKIVVDDDDAPNYERIELDFPEQTMSLLAGATRHLITEKMAEFFAQQVDSLEKFKGSLGGTVLRAIQEIKDPVELRNRLEELGVNLGDVDLDKYRSDSPDTDLRL